MTFESYTALVNAAIDAITAVFGDGSATLSESQALYFAGYSNEFGGRAFAKMVADGLVVQQGWGAGGHPRDSL
jgi:hypothetical protein